MYIVFSSTIIFYYINQVYTTPCPKKSTHWTNFKQISNFKSSNFNPSNFKPSNTNFKIQVIFASLVFFCISLRQKIKPPAYTEGFTAISQVLFS